MATPNCLSSSSRRSALSDESYGLHQCLAADSLPIHRVRRARTTQVVTSWPEAEQKTEWRVTLLIGAEGVISTGFSESSLTAYLNEKLGDSSDFSSFGLIILTVFSICGLTDIASNTAVVRSALTHPMRMLILATCACSFAFVLPVATPPKAIMFGTNEFADFLKTGLAFNIIAVFLGIRIIHELGSAVLKYIPEVCVL